MLEALLLRRFNLPNCGCAAREDPSTARHARVGFCERISNSDLKITNLHNQDSNFLPWFQQSYLFLGLKGFGSTVFINRLHKMCNIYKQFLVAVVVRIFTFIIKSLQLRNTGLVLFPSSPSPDWHFIVNRKNFRKTKS